MNYNFHPSVDNMLAYRALVDKISEEERKLSAIQEAIPSNRNDIRALPAEIDRLSAECLTKQKDVSSAELDFKLAEKKVRVVRVIKLSLLGLVGMLGVAALTASFALGFFLVAPLICASSILLSTLVTHVASTSLRKAYASMKNDFEAAKADLAKVEEEKRVATNRVSELRALRLDLFKNRINSEAALRSYRTTLRSYRTALEQLRSSAVLANEKAQEGFFMGIDLSKFDALLKLMKLTSVSSISEEVWKEALLPHQTEGEGVLCVIKREVMLNPCLSPSGHLYESSAIMKWLEKNGSCPLTRQTLLACDLCDLPENARQAISRLNAKMTE